MRKLRNDVVFTNAKILILKLITTGRISHAASAGCIYQCKDTNFKANHNGDTKGLKDIELYLPMQRY